MALVSSDNGDLLDFLCPTQSATQNISFRDNFCDSVFGVLKLDEIAIHGCYSKKSIVLKFC